MQYSDLALHFAKFPRNVHTVPTDGRMPRWFWVSAEQGKIYVSSGTTSDLNSNIHGRRLLNEDELETMLTLYQRRKRGEAVSVVASRTTQNQVYWYGIFADLCM